jgi:hypothetical protein
LVHFSTELVCSFGLTRTVEDASLGRGGIFCYNALAFWTQPLVGWAVDRWRCAKGCLFTGGAILLLAGVLGHFGPWPTVAFLGAGNSLVHIGAGALCIGLSRGRASGLGVLVGPGAAGLVLGVWISDQTWSRTPWLIACLLAANLAALWRIKESSECASAKPAAIGNRWSIPVALLVLICVALRSALGSGFSFSWKSDGQAVLAIGLAMSTGKIAGGFLADAAGWIVTVAVAIVFAIPFLWFGFSSQGAGLIGLALFQVPMAVTLGLMVRLIPARPAFAFGLASAAVYGGAFLVLGNYPAWLGSFGGLSALSLGVVGMLWLSARLIPTIAAPR